MQVALPTFSRGLKLVRIGVFIMLLQLVIGVVQQIKMLSIDDVEDVRNAFKWIEYLNLANLAATLAMFIGVARAIPELKRAGEPIIKVVIVAAGFAIATAALLWIYKTTTAFIEITLAPDTSTEAWLSGARDVERLRYVVILRDLAYGVALVSLIGIVRRSAIANDQLALRDVAASMGRALLVMVVGDLFFQLTYGLGVSVGVFGFVGGLLVAIYWIYCHARLQRFLENAAYFMNEPHNLPTATVVNVPAHAAPRAPKPAPRASTQPSAPRPPQPPAPPVSQPVIVAPPPRIEPPRAASSADGDDSAVEPQFLR